MSLYVRHLLFSLLCPWFMKPHPMSWGGWQISADGRTSEKWAAEVGGQSLRPPHSLCSSGGLALLHLVTHCYTLLHLVIPCHTLSHSVMLCHILSRLFTPFHTLSHLVIPRYIFSHHFNLVIPCQSTCLTREQLIVPWWLSQHTNWQIKIKPVFHKFKSNWRCH